jgi:ACS family hexuronate transporter-like MFS transporter
MTKPPIPHLRWYIAGLLCLASALNYLDRQTLSVLIGTIKEELQLTNASYGAINAWFLASYGVMYAVSGRVIDIIGTRQGFVVFVAGWSVANMLHVLATTVGQFSFFRLLLGVFEPGSFTGGVRAVSEWFPMRDRALAVGILNAGTAIGSMAAAPVVSFIAVQMGWRAAFVVTGLLGFVWVAAWWWLYKLPRNHPRLGAAERALITSDNESHPAAERAVPLGQLLRRRETWGCILIRALTDPISYFLLFWVPLYFQKRHGFDLKQLGMFVWIPFAAAALGSVVSGALPRFLIARGWELDRARKTTMALMTAAMFMCAVSATQVAHAGLALALVACMTFCHAGWGNITLPAEIFPKNAVGTVTGLGGTLGSWLGALSQLYIGRVVDAYGFAPIFIVCAGLYPVALVLVFALIGKLGITRSFP